METTTNGVTPNYESIPNYHATYTRKERQLPMQGQVTTKEAKSQRDLVLCV